MSTSRSTNIQQIQQIGIDAVRKRWPMYVGKDGKQSVRATLEVVKLARNILGSECIVSASLEPDKDQVVIVDLLNPNIPVDMVDLNLVEGIVGPGAFRALIHILTQLFVPCAFFHGEQCQPAVATALCRDFLVSYESPEFFGQVQFFKGWRCRTVHNFKGDKESVHSRDSVTSVLIRMVPDMELLGGEFDVEEFKSQVQEIGL